MSAIKWRKKEIYASPSHKTLFLRATHFCDTIAHVSTTCCIVNLLFLGEIKVEKKNDNSI